MTTRGPGRLVVHVGLPKTATTTLQEEVFPSLAGAGVAYLGVRHPREGGQDLAYGVLMDAIGTGRTDAARRTADSLCGASATTVLSEEMLVVSQRRLDWRTKLRRLKQVLDGVDHLLLVTVREPVSASFSFHVEIERHRAGRGPSWLPSLGDDRMSIYRYRTLLTFLDELFGRERIVVAAFEDVVKGDLERVWAALGLEPGEARVPPLPDHNRRERSGGSVATGVRYSALDHGRAFAKRLNLDQRRWSRLLAPALPVLRRLPTWEKRIPLPTEAERREARALYAPDVAWLRDEFGIDYIRGADPP